jgi:hypothetical protein
MEEENYTNDEQAVRVHVDGEPEEELPSSSDDDSSLGVPLFTTPQPPKPEEPPKGLEWHDEAIQECFDLALQTHDDDQQQPSTNRGEWSMPTLQFFGNQHDEEFLATWRPGSLSLPIWAVDPFTSS